MMFERDHLSAVVSSLACVLSLGAGISHLLALNGDQDAGGWVGRSSLTASLILDEGSS